MKTLIKNGTVITAEITRKADILVEDEFIRRIDEYIEDDEATIVDASGLLVLPGGVDPHVHLELPMAGTISADDHYTGGKAAAFGGTTTMIDFVSQEPVILAENIARHRAMADPKASIDYSLHMNITHFDDQVAEELLDLPQMGITSMKVFTAYNGRLRLDDGSIFKVMRIGGKNNLLTMVHAENGDVIDILVAEALAAGNTAPIHHALTRPAWGEVEASLRAAALAAQADSPLYLVHMNVAGEVDQLAYARKHGILAMGETCPQYLFFTEDDLRRPDGAKWVCSPPMRKAADQQGLWQALENGTIQVLATDHCPFFYNGRQPIVYEGREVAIPGKELGEKDFTLIPNGLPGIADRLPVFWTHAVNTGRISPNRFVELTATNPARIFGLYPKKGTLAEGSDADIALWDPEKELDYGLAWAHHRTDYNLYEGWKLRGYPVKVFLRGTLIVDDQNWLGKAGGGRFVHRQAGEIL
ncbi:MAG TPA: dihydropyrimidinase [Anaerolineaceae bacterium]|nr:dihydropyrimidinase [Anaerolineaceae bacterium]HQJ31934.1 dihydropyrimidinase [Anaerolineaceae bacterium]